MRHTSGCPARVERTDPRTATGSSVPVIRCLDCGSFDVMGRVDSPLTPGTPEWLNAWHNDPERVARGLIHAERQDPSKNPLHPLSTWPPGHEPKIGPR